MSSVQKKEMPISFDPPTKKARGCRGSGIEKAKSKALLEYEEKYGHNFTTQTWELEGLSKPFISETGELSALFKYKTTPEPLAAYDGTPDEAKAAFKTKKDRELFTKLLETEAGKDYVNSTK